MAPRARIFTWLLMHGRVKTNDFLYSLNIGQPSLCVFCGMILENNEHLFYDCSHARYINIWQLVGVLTMLKVDFVNGITSGSWLEGYRNYDQLFVASICASSIWWIWKTRCNKIFKDTF